MNIIRWGIKSRLFGDTRSWNDIDPIDQFALIVNGQDRVIQQIIVEAKVIMKAFTECEELQFISQSGCIVITVNRSVLLD